MPARPTPFRPLLLCQALLLALALSTANAPVQAQASPPATQFDLPSQPMGEAINAIAYRAGVQIAAPGELVRQRRAPALQGSYTVRQALERILSGSGLAVEEVAGRYVIRSAAPASQDASVVTLTPVLVQAVRTPRMQVYEQVGSTAVVSREEIDRLPPRNVSDVLMDIPGVATSQSRQNPGVAVNIRGLQGFGRVNVMIDGARQNFQQSGHGDSGAVYLDADLLGQVDVTKGPVSTVGGAGMIGGMVNFRTLSFRDVVRDGKDVGGRINLTTGSNAYDFQGSAAIGAKLGETLDVTAAVSRKSVGAFKKGDRNADRSYAEMLTLSGDPVIDQMRQDNLRSQVVGTNSMTSQKQTSGLLKFGWRPNADHTLEMGYVGFRADFDEGNKDDDIGGLTISSGNRVRSDVATLRHHWHPDNPWLNLRSSMYFTRTQNDSERQANADAGVGWSQMHFETNTFGITTENRSEWSMAGFDATWTAGGEFYRDWTRPGALAQEVGGTRNDSEVLEGGTPRGQRTVMSGFTELELKRGKWLEAAAGLRYDWFGLRGDGLMRVGRIYNGAGARPEYATLYTEFVTNRHDSDVAPSFRLAVRPIDAVQLFATYAHGLRPPSITESFRYGSHPGVTAFPYFPNPNLKAERSRNWEIGANFTLDGLLSANDQFRIKAAWFDTRVENYMVLAAIMSPSATSGQFGMNSPMSFVNLQDDFRSRGLEIQADYDVGVAFASLGYTHSLVDTGSGKYDPFPLGSSVGYPNTTLGNGGGANIWYVLPPVRKVTVSGGVRLLDRRLTLGARMRYEKPATNTSAWSSNQYARPYRIYDAWASYDVNKDLTVRLSVQNLLDENYAEMSGITYWIAPGRTVMASLNWRF